MEGGIPLARDMSRQTGVPGATRRAFIEIKHCRELIPIGYSASRPNPRPRRPLDEIVHLERYEESKGRSDEDVKRFVGSATLQGKFSRSDASKGEGE